VYNVIEGLDTPAVKFRTVGVPKLLPLMVGTSPDGDVDGPPKFSVAGPLTAVTVFPNLSITVTVMVCEEPAVCVPVPEILKSDGGPGITAIDIGLPLVRATSAVETLSSSSTVAVIEALPTAFE
jgi:hypothetical protein